MKNIEMTCGCSVCLCLLLCLVACLHSSHAQAYQFSHGWFPGRKRSSGLAEPPSSRRQSALMVEAFSHGASGPFSSAADSSPSASSSSSRPSQDYYPYPRASLSSSLPSSNFAAKSGMEEKTCHVKPQVQQLIMDLIEVRLIVQTPLSFLCLV